MHSKTTFYLDYCSTTTTTTTTTTTATATTATTAATTATTAATTATTAAATTTITGVHMQTMYTELSVFSPYCSGGLQILLFFLYRDRNCYCGFSPHPSSGASVDFPAV